MKFIKEQKNSVGRVIVKIITDAKAFLWVYIYIVDKLFSRVRKGATEVAS